MVVALFSEQMATDTSAELPAVFEGNLGEDGLAEFEPEAERAPLWRRVDNLSAVDARRWEPLVVRRETRWWPLVASVVLAAAIVGAAVAWVGLRTNVNNLPATPRSVATAPILPSEPNLTVPAVETPPPVAQAPSPSTAAAPSPDLPRPSVDPAFERTLASVRESYRSLDAASLTSVWPSADIPALSRAFSELKYQALSFDRCAVRPNGPSGAVASCEVSLAKAPKAGDASLQRRREWWTIVLDRSGERWTIAGLSVR